MDILSEIIASKRARLEATKARSPVGTTRGRRLQVRAPGPAHGCELH